jgi:hypothetical protein
MSERRRSRRPISDSLVAPSLVLDAAATDGLSLTGAIELWLGR